MGRCLVVLSIAVLSSGQTPARPPAPDVVERAVRAAYLRQFGEAIERPGIFNDPRAVNCRGNGHLMTTAYLRTSARTSRLLTMRMPRDASAVEGATESPGILTPAGAFRVLVLLVQHPETVGERGPALWAAAQRRINEDHAAFAKSRGFAAPIVVFENTNVVIQPTEIDDPKHAGSMRTVAARRGHPPTSYQLIMSVDMSPAQQSGGHADLLNRSIYMGRFLQSSSLLAERDWQMVANAAYHHEVAHHWGWQHGWAPSCGKGGADYQPFIAPPVLFGWESRDGSGLPEISGTAPYRPRP